MQKIPVGRTIAFAYLFLFTHIGTVIGIAWLPAVISAAANYLTRLYAAMHREELEAGASDLAVIYLGLSLAALLVMLFASSVVAIAISRQVAGQNFHGVVLYLAAGRTELRMLSANIRFLAGATALFVIAGLVSMTAFYLAGVPLGSAAAIEPNAATILAALISWAVILYAALAVLRMGFLLAPVVAAEENGGLRRSHDLTKGTILRLLAILAALGAPVLLLLLAGEAVLLSSAFGADMAEIESTEFFRRASEAMEQKLLVWHIFSAVVFILGSGLIYSGAAFAYRALTQNKDAPSSA
jgi:hypothetical protein